MGKWYSKDGRIFAGDNHPVGALLIGYDRKAVSAVNAMGDVKAPEGETVATLIGDVDYLLDVVRDPSIADPKQLEAIFERLTRWQEDKG